MNPDKLEKYILDHREQFDDMEPDPAIWDRIETQKAPVIRIKWKKVAWQAAAAAAIFIASYFFHDFMATRNAAPEQMFSRETEDLSPMAKELIEAEAYYTSMIRQKQDEIFSLTASNPDIRHEIDMEMVDLDRVFTELKEDLKDNAHNEEVIEAMIQNYRLKLDILEEMLTQLKQSQESQKDEGNENQAVEI